MSRLDILHLVRRLRALSAYVYDDLSVGDEAADVIESQQQRIEYLQWAVTFLRAGEENDNA